MAKPFNGYPSWNAWNVSLWINNDEGLYSLALDCLKANGNNRRRAARAFCLNVGTTRTPDGGKYNATAVCGAMEGMS
jgi:hypothetical protein